MNISLINVFLSAEPANETEKLVQVNVRNLNDNYNKKLVQRNELASMLKKAEEELLKVSGALENQLAMAELLAKEKGLQPLELQQEEQTEAMQAATE